MIIIIIIIPHTFYVYISISIYSLIYIVFKFFFLGFSLINYQTNIK